MRIITHIALAALAVLSLGIAGKSATAMTVATPISVAAADTTLVHYNHGHHYGWYRGHHYGWYHHHHH